MPLRDLRIYQGEPSRKEIIGWPATGIALALGIPVVYLILIPESLKGGDTWLGILLGSYALFFMVVAFLYSWRRARPRFKLDKLSNWLYAHIWLGISAIGIVLVHSDFQFEFGLATWAFITFVLSALSGAVGMFIFKYLPPSISGESETYLTPEEVMKEMDEVVKGIEKLLKTLKAPEDEDEAKKAAQEIAERERKLEALKVHLESEWRQQAPLEAWLYFHIPVSVLAFVLCVAHAASIFYYH